MLNDFQYALDFYKDASLLKAFLSSRLILCNNIGRGSSTGVIPGVSDFVVDRFGARNKTGGNFSITHGNTISYYGLDIDSDGQDCTQIIFPGGQYLEDTTLFPLKSNVSFSSTPVANPVPPYLFIEAELTRDLKNISVFHVRAASSTWACEWTNYALPFVSVLRDAAGCTFADRVDALVQTGLPIGKQLATEYVLLRISLSAILGVAPFCCFSVDLLRQRYWLPFREALAASEFRAALAFFDDPQYNLVGYERFFKK